MFETFKNSIKSEVEEFLKTGKMQGAIALSQQTGQAFNPSAPPMYFVGNPEAPWVLVHLNPKEDSTSRKHESFDEYFKFHRYFGKHMYGSGGPQTHRSPFDDKQILFLREFGMDLPDCRDRFTNLEHVIDDKLQLELIPYRSRTFSRRGFTKAILKPHLERILQVISERPRDYVIFCGAIFEDLFRDEIMTMRPFRLTKKDGALTRYVARFSKLTVAAEPPLVAGLAHTFAERGIPMAAYGRRCKELYDGLITSAERR